ncbi:glycoside hydrolase superfamily [Triangularia setosa]|uniref:Beta-glucosidase cel3A n=1 Tax=Triangularia setosa TaxID=2587417 RepID=A0AAN7A6G3_9PEZI|nr:glycoside hydrolase superfamily [Podospora setosa]
MKCLKNIGRYATFWGQNPRSLGHAGPGGKAPKWKLSTKKAVISVLSAIQTLANPNPSRNHQKPILIEQEHKDAIAPYKPPSELPFYGRSPPVYPAPIANGSTPLWSQAHHLAALTLSNLTLPEKLNLTIGHEGPCVGNTAPIPRLSIPSLCIADGPASLRGQEYVSAFPAGIHLSATFDTDLMSLYGRALGQEFYNRGVNIALGPVAGPVGRIIKGGRNWEGGGPDPYLAGKLFAEVTRGMQDEGVLTVGKHWVGNEQETRRRWDWEDGKHAVSAEIDDRTLHELYVWPFMEGLKEGMGGVMCSYQRVNHSYGCQNSKLINGVLKTELGFEGFVVSDWDGQVSGVGSANAGLDLVMPGRGYWGEKKLGEAVRNGSVTEERVDDMARRVLAGWYLLGQDSGYPERAIWGNLERHWPVDVMEDHGGLIREIGAAGTVVVKNENGALPLGKKRRFVCVFGYDAQVKASPWTNRDRYGGGYDENYGWETFNGTLITGGGSGSTTPPYVVSPFEAIQHRVRKEGGVLRWDFWSGNPTPYLNADVCTVLINSYASESFDRKNLTDKFSDDLVLNVASWCSNTFVIIHSTGIRLVEAFINHPNVTAIIMAGLPGQESGNSLVDILWGDVNPSGRLPYTIAKSEQDYGAVLDPAGTEEEDFPEDDFSREGVFLDYRAFDKNGITPRFEFGFGLSYTSFSYSSVHTTVQPRADTNMGEWPDENKQIVQGGHPGLWDVVVVVRCHVTNTGESHGAEIAQLYLGVPNPERDGKTPLRQLRGFKKVGPLAPGETRQVTFELTRRDLSVWDVVKQQWKMRRGEYKVQIGASSRDLRLELVITLE